MKKRVQQLLVCACFLSVAAGCSTTKIIRSSARAFILSNEALQPAHVGISIYEPATGKWWYNYQGDKYFVPASNTKLATCYAAMKYLGDSLVSARISVDGQGRLRLFPAADPTFLNPEFANQPLLQKLKQYPTILLELDGWKDQRWGSGWSWSDYDADYMAERSPLPVYGNVARFSLVNDTLKTVPAALSVTAESEVKYNQSSRRLSSKSFRIDRSLDANDFTLRPSGGTFSEAVIPFRADAGFVARLLADTLKATVIPATVTSGTPFNSPAVVIHSQPTDSLLKPMMHRSDNFFAEQALLMVSNKVLGFMSDRVIIDTLLNTLYADLPQAPRWVDGSGLSRYNLFTPQDFVTILAKMKQDFGMDRIREILPTGNEGTLRNYYKADSSFLYAKTGTLSGVVAISGFLTTQKGKELIFSVLVNNHNASATQVRRAVEQFLQKLRRDY